MEIMNNITKISVVVAIFWTTLSLANENTSKQPVPGSKFLEGSEHCHSTIQKYVEWRARALAISSKDTFKKPVHDWLLDSGFYWPKGNIYSATVQREAEIGSIDGIYVKCRRESDTDNRRAEGSLTIKYTDKPNQTTYYGFSNNPAKKRHTVSPSLTVKEKTTGGTISDFGKKFANLEYETFPDKYHSEIQRLVSVYQREIDLALGAKPDNLVFEEDVTDLFFDWPHDALVTMTESTRWTTARGSKVNSINGQMQRMFRLEPDENGIRVSFISDGIKMLQDGESKLKDADLQSTIDNCISMDDSDFEILCLPQLHFFIPEPYTLDIYGNISQPIQDEKHASEILQWIDSSMTGLENQNLYRDKTQKALTRYSDEGDYIGRSHTAVHFRVLHSTRLQKNEINEDIQPVRLGRNFYPPASLRRTLEENATLTYLGRTPCDAKDQNKSCVLLKSLVEGSTPPSKSWSKNTTELVVEPHTLLPHSIKKTGQAEEYEEGEDSPLSSTEVSIDITFQYKY